MLWCKTLPERKARKTRSSTPQTNTAASAAKVLSPHSSGISHLLAYQLPHGLPSRSSSQWCLLPPSARLASLCCKVLSLPSQASASLQDHNLQVWLDSLPSCPPVPPTPIARLASLCKQSPESAQLRHHTDTDHHHLQCVHQHWRPALRPSPQPGLTGPGDEPLGLGWGQPSAFCLPCGKLPSCKIANHYLISRHNTVQPADRDDPAASRPARRFKLTHR